jgi:hypothetical protein
MAAILSIEGYSKSRDTYHVRVSTQGLDSLVVSASKCNSKPPKFNTMTVWIPRIILVMKFLRQIKDYHHANLQRKKPGLEQKYKKSVMPTRIGHVYNPSQILPDRVYVAPSQPVDPGPSHSLKMIKGFIGGKERNIIDLCNN